MIRRMLVAASAAALIVAGAPSRAGLAVQPVEPIATAVATAVAFRYFPGDVSMPDAPLRVFEGGTVQFAPMDALGNHSITSVEYRDGDPLFSSDLIGPGQTSRIQGVELLPVGKYAFTCSVHEYMRGQLDVISFPA